MELRSVIYAYDVRYSSSVLECSAKMWFEANLIPGRNHSDLLKS